ncbi:hypothetical protein UA75_29480 [Actinoalloteichus sp. GBA129-24]|nr:hypothetical protein UA75_29480 [Actinoalloteichus sp. GBA129-24]
MPRVNSVSESETARETGGMTQDVYLGRGLTDRRTAEILEAALPAAFPTSKRPPGPEESTGDAASDGV